MLYADPRTIADPTGVLWYHTMDLPGVGTVSGQWDLRSTAEEYLGQLSFTGHRCLDVGAASGFLSFEMERRGAREVVSMDLDPSLPWDIVPYAHPDYDPAAMIEMRRRELRQFQDGYWLAHRLLGSRARVHYGTAYHLPADLGQFDMVMVGMILPHCRDPFRVLEQAAARSDHTIVVTQQAPLMPDAWAYFMPDPETRSSFAAWWALSEDCLTRMLGVLGFRVVRTIRAEHRSVRGLEPCSTLVAEPDR